jgi:hypothetical protein
MVRMQGHEDRIRLQVRMTERKPELDSYTVQQEDGVCEEESRGGGRKRRWVKGRGSRSQGGNG